MYKFSKRSNKNLNECHEDLRILFRTVVEDYDCSVICGRRGEEAQNAAYYAFPQLSKVKWPNSAHNAVAPKLVEAADVIPYPVDWKDTDRFYHFGGYVLGTAQQLLDQGKMKHRISWGGDWDGDTDLKDQTFIDFPHFELIGVEDGEN